MSVNSIGLLTRAASRRPSLIVSLLGEATSWTGFSGVAVLSTVVWAWMRGEKTIAALRDPAATSVRTTRGCFIDSSITKDRRIRQNLGLWNVFSFRPR